MPQDLSTGFVARLRARDPAAWFELWEIFGPVLSAQLSRWGRGLIGPETVRDLSQETLAALAGAIDRHDPERGVRFSTWLLAIARHTLGDEMDRRHAEKRGGGRRPLPLPEGGVPDRRRPGAGRPGLAPDAAYERAVFDAKVEAALRMAERESDFLEFSVFRLRVLEGRSGREVARGLGTSEATVSRRLERVRGRVRGLLLETFARFSFTEEELAELARNGLDANPNKGGEAAFDQALAEVYHRITHGRAERESGALEMDANGMRRGPSPEAAP